MLLNITLRGRYVLPVIAVMIFSISQAKAENELTLDQAYRLVLNQNPMVQSYQARYIGAEGNRIQQSLLPNPEASFEVENFAGDEGRSGVDEAELTLGIAQKIEIAGKRSNRTRVADLEKQQIKQEAIASIQSVLAQTNQAFANIAVAKKQLQYAENRLSVADKMHKAVKVRVNAAKAPKIQHTKVDIEVAAAKLEKRKAEKELTLAKTVLANLMGVPSINQDIKVDISSLPEIPSYDAIANTLEQTPMATMSQLAVLKQQSVLELERSNAISDPTVGLGVRRFNEDDDTAFLASVSIPLNFFDRNQGNILSARANVKSAQAEDQNLRLNLSKQAVEIWQAMSNARQEALDYQTNIIPSARKALEQAEYGYGRGAFSFLDLLDAQRTLFDVQENYLEALNVFYKNKSQIDMLSGSYTPYTTSLFNEKE
ncbi:MAG: TolC family protein [Alphaproteobacteria bacterium]|nr:TolC family protein [Alphaproteobacteria bacterium]